MNEGVSRRAVLAAGAAAVPMLAGCTMHATDSRQSAMPLPEPGLKPRLSGEQLFKISLAEWSFHKALKGGQMDHLDFPLRAKREFGIDAVEYVNQFFKGYGGKASIDTAYVAELRRRCEGESVTSVLIMCDGEGALGDADEAKRRAAVENHYKWAEAAAALGCHSIRVNAQSSGGFQEQMDRAADGLRQLCEHCDSLGLNVIVENHWGLSSNGAWLSGVMRKVAHPRIGTLPDFGNFDPKEYDRYQGVADMMPFARGVSAKSIDFDPATGDHASFDYRRLLKIVMDAGYHGRLGIEYEGEKMGEPEGIRATKALLLKIRDEMSV